MRKKVLAFLDFEFNCPTKNTVSKREIISVGAVFRYADGTDISEFHSYVKPSKISSVSNRSVKITGITQKQLNQSPRFDVVSRQLLNMVDSINPDEFFVWGTADKVEVKRTTRISNADKRMIGLANKFHNLQETVCGELKLSNVYSLERIADVYDIPFVHKFSALEDAKCLADVYFAYKSNKANQNKIEGYEKFYKYRSVIGKYKIIENNIKMSILRLFELENKQFDHYIEDAESNEGDSLEAKIQEKKLYIKEQKKELAKMQTLYEEAEEYMELIKQ